MLRAPQHERKKINDMNTPPFVLSLVEELQEDFFRNLLDFMHRPPHGE